MSSKVRIHDLAKQYGMPGKALAAKLRDFGFSQAKSHMSALDPFEVLQAEGLLEANGIVPVASEPEGDAQAALGGLKVKKKHKKKKKVQEPPPEEAAAALVEPVEGLVKEPVPEVEAPPAPQPAAAEEPAPATASAVGYVPAERVPAERAPAEIAEESGAEQAPVAETAADEGQEAQESRPRGTVVGFIDPTSFQRAEPRRKAESRRLQPHDDFTPDVRPTFTKAGRGSSGPRGNLTAAQLREREQSRFLRRQGRPGATGGRGRRLGGPARPREQVRESPLAGQQVVIEAPITMSKLAEALKLKTAVVMKRALEERLGVFTLNSLLDDDTATLLAGVFDVELTVRHEISAEQALLEDVVKKRSQVEEQQLVERTPTVAFLGHVDHGKTTLIDKIRETKVADHEAGGITQHIGAYQVHTSKGHPVTIVDTPGHEAFTAMRARGAKAVDIVVLVVAGDDGVMPNTVEALNHARAAETPIVVAINKSDKPDFDANSTIRQLMGHELVPEQFGGSTAMFQTSGVSGEGIDDLLEHIFLMSEVELGLKAHPRGPASGVVLEAELQQGRGIVAHLLIQDGTLNRGDVILAGEGYGKVKSIRGDRGEELQSAGPSLPVEVTGLVALPGVGNPFHVIESLANAKEIATERERNNRAVALAGSKEPARDLAAILGSSPKTTVEVINLIVRTDVQGSVEVIRHEVAKLLHDEVEIKLLHSGVGPITESDVDLAATSQALLVAFHVGVNGKARKEADRHGLDIRRYDVIYELIGDLKKLMEGALAPDFLEEVQGHAEIRKIFKSSKLGMIAGCYVLDGKILRNSKVRLLRDDTVVHTGDLGSLRRETEDVKSVREGFECGIVLKDYRDVMEGDVIECFTMKEVKRTLEGSRT